MFKSLRGLKQRLEDSRRHSDHVQPSRRVLLERLADTRLSYIVGTGTDAEVQRVESRVQGMRDSPGGVQNNVDHARVIAAVTIAGAQAMQGAVSELTPDELENMRRRHHVGLGSMKRLRRGRRMRRAIASGDRARVDSLLARHAERSPTAQLGKSLARLRDPLAEHARLCSEAADINEAIVLPEPDEHADVDALAVPEERRPSKGASIRRLLEYLIRLVLRRWVRRIDGK